MIKFNSLIHKETGMVIKYEDWKENVKTDTNFRIRTSDVSCYRYSPFYCLTSDDFEIIYDSEFTLEELGIIFRGNQRFVEKLMKKIRKDINDKEFYKSKYGIEV